jgi:subtilisin family serine protease/Tfp pilus assembly protein PilZ
LNTAFKTLMLAVICAFDVSLALAQDYVPGQMIVKLRAQGPAGASAGGVQGKAFSAKMAEKAMLMKSFDGMSLHHYQLKAGQDLETTMLDLRNDPEVEYVEHNFILRKQMNSSGSSQVLSASDVAAMGTSSSTGTYTQNFASVKVTESWVAMSASSLITPIVAVVDTGVDYNHNVFKNSGAIWKNPGETGTDSRGQNKSTNGIDDDGNGFIDDVMGWNFHSGTNNPMDDDEHGTHVAGIILGVGQDIFATTIAPAKIRIMALKFLGADGSGSTSDAINAINYAVNNGANVINNSWGGSSYSQSLHDALTYAYTKRAVLVAAAGNFTSENDASPLYPASYPVPSLISVAASSDYDVLASFSNWGKATVHVAAPGVGILSTVPGNSYRYLSGTSMASPFVAGMTALAYREAPNLTGYQVKNIILATVNPISSLSTKVFTSGRVNAYNSIAESKNETTIQAIQPAYVASAPAGVRAPASSSTSGGCGMISTAASGQLIPGSGPRAVGSLLLTFAFALPLMAWVVLRRREQQKQRRRKFDRFVMNSEIKVRVGERELSGQMKTISEGGISFCADQMLEKGGMVTMMITGPDGSQQIQVQGHVVWNEQNQSYGVAFDEAKEGALSAIRSWTSNLIKAQ